MSIPFVAFCVTAVAILKELNAIVDQPYMDEPFHIPQVQAYCRGEYSTWDPKITTPPGLYIMSLLLKRLFLFKCNIPMLRLTTLLSLLALPIALTRLVCYHKRERPPAVIKPPVLEATVVAAFPIAWFFGFLYYTDVPSLLFVVATIAAATEDRHWLAALLGLVSCTFRQNNIIWMVYAYASSQLTYLRFRRPISGPPPAKLHDPPALHASAADLFRAVWSIPRILPVILPSFLPYSLVLLAFGSFIIWNGGIVLGDRSNHIPAFHIPQLYYFVASVTFFGWPVLLSGPQGTQKLIHDVWKCMFGNKIRIMITALVLGIMCTTVKLFTIHHPFLLADNRHYTFYVWRRIYMFHPLVPYLLVPIYLACAWAWFLRAGRDQTLLQTLLLPILVIPTLLPTPLLEPRYFLIPYVLLRAQIADVPTWGLALEGVWYTLINAVTMSIFLYYPRGDVRFMW
ncbi:glycosyltransferase family 59 protein [Macrolepiota fuliginosa MF-IS2]|uniref:Dol-P-Glc:Glc(2)Man(9)GlcNAc(2)-PP-Dol alpha-1,2-glucosyltransferase n=1 Tax=Macrolepiota fuliginosa MF-IS2 TaxID=1400762 RepID=A0A9P5XJF3_9AGAR|nr:glycosyltransferase family 59 protein [Macrolepiota fuliginosa MF-IS2]